MKVKLLRQIAEAILHRPSSLQMSVLHSNRKGMYVDKECATSHCICGWGAVLTGKDFGAGCSGEIAFGIDFLQKRRLFWVSGWPERFQTEYKKVKTPRAKAKIAAARIEHFISTKGAE